MPRVSLIDYTGAGSPDPLYAARILAFTKNTRLKMSPGGLRGFMDSLIMSDADILAEVAYMATTIPSSWEFADVTFLVENVSRATAQQITRTRTASFAMQSQRVTDMSDVTWDRVGRDAFEADRHDSRMRNAIKRYSEAVEEGMPLEDARDLLPIGVHCNLVNKYNLRGLVELCRARDSLRVQGPFRDVCAQMKGEVLRVWPWAAPFFVPPQAAAIEIIEGVAKELAALENLRGALYKGMSGRLAKAADLVKKG